MNSKLNSQLANSFIFGSNTIFFYFYQLNILPPDRSKAETPYLHYCIDPIHSYELVDLLIARDANVHAVVEEGEYKKTTF